MAFDRVSSLSGKANRLIWIYVQSQATTPRSLDGWMDRRLEEIGQAAHDVLATSA